MSESFESLLSAEIAKGEVVPSEDNRYPDIRLVDLSKLVCNIHLCSSGYNGTAFFCKTLLMLECIAFKVPMPDVPRRKDSLAMEYVNMLAAQKMVNMGYPFVPRPYGMAKTRMLANSNMRASGVAKCDGKMRVFPILFMERIIGINYESFIRESIRSADDCGFEWGFFLMELMSGLLVMEAGIRTCGITHYDLDTRNVICQSLSGEYEPVAQTFHFDSDSPGETESYTVISRFKFVMLDWARAHVDGRDAVVAQLGYPNQFVDGSTFDWSKLNVHLAKQHPMHDVYMFIQGAIWSIEDHFYRSAPITPENPSGRWSFPPVVQRFIDKFDDEFYVDPEGEDTYNKVAMGEEKPKTWKSPLDVCKWIAENCGEAFNTLPKQEDLKTFHWGKPPTRTQTPDR